MEQAAKIAKSGDKTTARQMFADIVKADPNNETAWMWLAFCAQSRSERKRYLEQVLEINPINFQAQAELDRILTREAKIEKPESSSSAKTILAIGTASGVIGIFFLPGWLGLIALICGITASVMGEKKGRAVALLGLLDMVLQYVMLQSLTSVSYLF